VAALLRRHAAVAGGRAGPHCGRSPPERFLGLGGQRAEAHAGNGHGNLQVDRLLGEARSQHDIGAAFFPVSLQRISRDRGAQKQQVVEIGQFALGAAAADIVDAGGRGALDF